MFCWFKKRDQLHSLDFNKTMIDAVGKVVVLQCILIDKSALTIQNKQVTFGFKMFPKTRYYNRNTQLRQNLSKRGANTVL